MIWSRLVLLFLMGGLCGWGARWIWDMHRNNYGLNRLSDIFHEAIMAAIELAGTGKPQEEVLKLAAKIEQHSYEHRLTVFDAEHADKIRMHNQASLKRPVELSELHDQHQRQLTKLRMSLTSPRNWIKGVQ